MTLAVGCPVRYTTSYLNRLGPDQAIALSQRRGVVRRVGPLEEDLPRLLAVAFHDVGLFVVVETAVERDTADE